MYDLMKRRSNQTPKSNKIHVPEARAAMDKFKMEAAAEVGVKAKEGTTVTCPPARSALLAARW